MIVPPNWIRKVTVSSMGKIGIASSDLDWAQIPSCTLFFSGGVKSSLTNATTTSPPTSISTPDV